ncbi:hypothetical protein [Pseudomonas cerasi]
MPILTRAMGADYRDRDVFVSNPSLPLSPHSEASLTLKDREFEDWRRRTVRIR